MVTITEFLLARIAEDEAVARGAIGTHWDGRAFQQIRTECGDDPHYYKIASGQVLLEHWEQGGRVDPGTTFQHIARHDPARVLAECAAKRAIIKAWVRTASYRDYEKFEAEYNDGLEFALECLAAAYKDHPDYRQEWAA